MQSHPDRSELAKTAMVSSTPFADIRDPVGASDSPGFHSEAGRDISSHSDSEPNSMAPFVRAFTTAGFSKQAATVVGEAGDLHATRKTYNTRIRKYRAWCKQNKVDACRASLREVSDLLTFIFN
jgi:hypothetical protein